MREEWSRSLNAAHCVAIFASLIACNSTFLHGQGAPPVPANPLKNAVAPLARQRAEVRPQRAAAPNAPLADWGQDEEEVERAALEPMGARLNMMQMRISVEHSIFGTDDIDGTRQLKKILNDKLVLIKREYPALNDLEIRRVEVAGLGDIKRFQDQVTALAVKHRDTRWNDGVNCQELFAELPRMQQRIQGVHFFGKLSLLTKTLRVIVTKNELTAQEIPGQEPALSLSENKPILNGGLAIRHIQLTDGMALALTHIQVNRPVLQMAPARRAAQALPQLQRPVLRMDDKYYLKVSQLIEAALELEVPIRNEQRPPLLAMLRRTLKQSVQIPLHDPNIALLRLSEVSEEDYLTVLDATQWKTLQRRFEAAKVGQEKQDPDPTPPVPAPAKQPGL